MQISKVTLIAFLAGALTLPLHAQPASAEVQNKALELLRQTIAQDQKQPNQAHPAVSTLPVGTVPAPGMGMAAQPRPADMSQPRPVVMASPASSGQQQQALQLLRQTIDQERAKAPQSPSTVTSTKQASGSNVRPSSKSAKPGSSGSASVQTGSAAQGTMTAGQPAVPETPAGPKTKQERLMDLLEQYKADKLTPAEYHAQRAKILSEP